MKISSKYLHSSDIKHEVPVFKKIRNTGENYVYINPNGRFCNVLYDACAMFAYGEKYNKIPKIDKKIIKRCPFIIELEFLRNMLCEPIECDNYYKFSFVDPTDEIPYFDGNVELIGYMQNYKFFSEHLDVLIDKLKCPGHILTKLNNHYGDLSDVVCAHIRKGDYARECEDKYFQPDIHWYINAARKHFPNHKIIIVSDDINWCKEQLGSEFMYVDEGMSVLDDFYTQTLCYANICSCSTFSLMGAILNKNHRAIVPDKFFIGKMENFKDVLVPDWCIRESENMYEKFKE